MNCGNKGHPLIALHFAGVLYLSSCHLLKAVEGWSDLGMGTFELRYLRDKQQREVDFVVIRDRKRLLLSMLAAHP